MKARTGRKEQGEWSEQRSFFSLIYFVLRFVSCVKPQLQADETRNLVSMTSIHVCSNSPTNRSRKSFSYCQSSSQAFADTLRIMDIVVTHCRIGSHRFEASVAQLNSKHRSEVSLPCSPDDFLGSDRFQTSETQSHTLRMHDVLSEDRFLTRKKNFDN